ncbi:hypothetical protein PVL29_010635 [Vitis rotundifolia]|uniref:Beta-galactosidase n=1 Tax=Vitis rotundifolia TaxID=103349 RepID=A0AA39DTQ3_VITRO|nr:hypothetical protein PVL29_010635 [Vitis rotundifolia]
MGSPPSFLVLSLFVLSFCLTGNADQITSDARGIMINGERKIFISGSIHYPRSTPEMWPDLIQKSKDGGLNTIETYVFWDLHEPQRRQYDFTGNRDLVRFIKAIQAQGLYAVLRIGPYVCAEWTYGGFPVWLHNQPGIQLRTNNTVYMSEMQTFTTMIVDMMKKEQLFASQGGPIIISQIENEYGTVMGAYHDAGVQYLNWCAQMAAALDTGVPWIMCKQDNAPQPMINTCNGYYCDQFTPNNPNSPKMWTENWTGWFKNWGGSDPHRTAEDIAFSVARFYQLGGTFQNYYMYHGGTNFGRTAGGPYITTSYDYDAPLNEYGNKNQPKWGHLRDLHLLLLSMEKALTYGEVKNVDYGTQTSATIYCYQGKSSCFFGNSNADRDVTINYGGVNYTIPAWSVSILPDCSNEVYNTAKVNSQYSTFVKKGSEAENEPNSLQWTWRGETIQYITPGRFTASELLDQKTVVEDTSDYLYYMTSVDISNDDPIWGKDLTLSVNTSGHILHAFVNGEHIGYQYALLGQFEFQFRRSITLQLGKNDITLLSATVGLTNVGPYFDMVNQGIHGPVQIIASNGSADIIKDLSNNQWKIFLGRARYNQWKSDNLPVNRSFVWYKTTFDAPPGEDPVVVDLMGLGKGEAWVNGNNLGRYWPSYIAGGEGCSPDCDYRGPYNAEKCNTNCGNPSQRWYHVPRSFLASTDNRLVLFEEFGGNPSSVTFQTDCWERLCQCSAISGIKFASFGDPQGTCGKPFATGSQVFEKGTCEAADALSIIQKLCVGKYSCSIDVSEQILGPAGCTADTKRLAVEAIC